MSGPVFRFAPSPNGYLHLGHALSALINFDMARAVGGRLLLRIEDIDHTRCRPEYEAAIYEDLAWLGIAWEEPVRRQSEHFNDYQAALARQIEIQQRRISVAEMQVAVRARREAEDGTIHARPDMVAKRAWVQKRGCVGIAFVDASPRSCLSSSTPKPTSILRSRA